MQVINNPKSWSNFLKNEPELTCSLHAFNTFYLLILYVFGDI